MKARTPDEAEQDERRRRRRHILGLTVVGLPLVLFTAVQGHLRQYDFPNFVLHAVFNLNFVLLLTVLVLMGRNFFKLAQMRHTPHARGGLRLRVVLYSLGLILPITLMAFLSFSETVITAVDRWFEPPIDKMLDDALEVSEASLALARGTAQRQQAAELDERLEAVRAQVADYKEEKRLHVPVRKSYVMALGLLAMAALFSASWAAFKVAHGISEPVSRLAEAAQAIAASPESLDREPMQPDGNAPGEIRILIESFEQMRRTLQRNQQVIARATEELRERAGQLEESHRRIGTILSDISAGVLALDGGGRITLANRKAEAMLGLPSPATGTPFGGDVPAGAAGPWASLAEMVEQVRHTGHRAGPTGLQLADGALVRLLSATVSPLETEHGSVVVVLEDLTELIQAQRLAAWREVARRVAHEIKNPLTPIQLSAQRLRRRSKELPDALQALVEECTATIVEEVDTMRRLVNDFSQFARLPRARPMPADLNGLVRTVARLFQSEPEGAPGGESGTIRLELCPTLPRLLLDPDLMRQVLVNLVKNGLEATAGRGPVRLSTAYRAELQAVCLCVADDGPGIAPELLDKLFLPYFSTKGEGTGLGLTIVHQIVSDHYGYVRVRSAPGEGTAVTIELPAAR